MKKLVAFAVLAFSFSSFALDVDKYCLPYLNGSLETQGEKPQIMEGFTASKQKLEVAGNMVDTVILTHEDPSLVDATKKSVEVWGEESVQMIYKMKKGKRVKDYKLIIKRDKEGNLLSISKKPILLRDFRINSDTLYFKPQGGTCIPEKFISRAKLKFSVELCREIDRFYAENPTAKECLAARHDQKLASLVREFSKGLPEKVILGLEKSSEDMSSIYAAKHRVDCTENGLDGIVTDEKIWENYQGKRGEEKVKSPEGKEE